jgi:putative transposase
LRDVVNAIFYLTRTGSQWRMLPKDFPPYSPVHGYLSAWRQDRTWQRLHFALHQHAREAAAREFGHTAGAIDPRDLLLVAMVHAAIIQGRDRAVRAFEVMGTLFPWL